MNGPEPGTDANPDPGTHPVRDASPDATRAGPSARRARRERRRPAPDDDHRVAHAAVFIVLVLVATAIALAIHRIEPEQPGAFYTPPTPLPAGAPGTILRREPLAGAPAGAQGWRVLYLSTGLQGQPIAVSGTVFAPSGATPGTGPGGARPVVAWAHPTTGVAPKCAPSLETAGGAASIPGLATFLANGAVVAVTDYPGLGTPGPHPYLVGESEGRAVLDSVRAAHNLEGSGAGTTFALWGHSQGGHAALFAAQQQPSYAPDLTLVGVAAAAPATELGPLLQKDIGGVAGNVLASMAVVSWSEVFADQGVHATQVLEQPAVPIAKLIADNCIETRAQLVVDLPDAEILRVGFIENPPWSTPPWDGLLQQNTPGATPITVPVLVNQGSADTVVRPSVTAQWVAAQCVNGVTIDQQIYDGVTHTDIGFDSAAATAAWIADRFAGATPQPAGCTTTTVTPPPATPGTSTA